MELPVIQVTVMGNTMVLDYLTERKHAQILAQNGPLRIPMVQIEGLKFTRTNRNDLLDIDEVSSFRLLLLSPRSSQIYCQ